MGASVTIGSWTHETLANPAPVTGLISNTEWIDTAGGYPRAVKWGDDRITGQYAFSVDATDLSSFNSVLSGGLNTAFSVTDHEGTMFNAKIVEVKKTAYNPTHTLIVVSVEEVPAA